MLAVEKNTLFEKHLFRVEGMHCIKCIRKIQSIGSEFQSIKKLNVYLGEHLVVTEACSGFPLSDFIQKVQTGGFDIKLLPETEHSVAIKTEQSFLLMRIGVAGFCAGNIMLLSTAEYLGARFWLGKLQSTVL